MGNRTGENSSGRLPPLWTCPRCGNRFVTRNLQHSCGRYRLADHFRSRDPMVRDLFKRFRALARACGPVTVYAQKTRIVFQARIRFAAAAVRRCRLAATLCLKRRIRHPSVRRVEFIPPWHVHHLRLSRPEDFDEGLAAIVREAYELGGGRRGGD